MMEFMEPETFSKDNRSITLEEPDRWTDECKAFLGRTANSTAESLLEEEFLLASPGPSCLIPYIGFAERIVKRSRPLAHH